MSTKTTTTAGFNQAGMNTYNQLMPSFGSAINSYINNPFSNPFFQTQQQMGFNTANQMNQTNMSNISRNLMMSGLQSNSPAGLEMMNNQMRAGTNLRANLGFLNPVQNAFTAQQNALGMAGSFRPLQTSQTQTKSGTGTWLPALASILTGGLLGGGGGGGNSGGGDSSGWLSGSAGAMGALYSPMQSPFFGTTGPQSPMGQDAPDVGGYNFGSNPFIVGGM